MDIRLQPILLVALIPLGLALSGCGPDYPETVPVSGTVTLGGQPVTGASIVFTPEAGDQATATTDSSGQFQLSTYRLADGAAPGHYRVTVAKTTVEPGEEEKVVFLVPKKYGNPDTSGLECDVQLEMGPVQFDLQPEPAPAELPPEEPAPAEETGAKDTP